MTDKARKMSPGEPPPPCSEPGCGQPRAYRDGRCRRCHKRVAYTTVRRPGSGPKPRHPDGGYLIRRMSCIIDDPPCPRAAVMMNGLCNIHEHRRKRYGDPRIIGPRGIYEGFRKWDDDPFAWILNPQPETPPATNSSDLWGFWRDHLHQLDNTNPYNTVTRGELLAARS